MRFHKARTAAMAAVCVLWIGVVPAQAVAVPEVSTAALGASELDSSCTAEFDWNEEGRCLFRFDGFPLHAEASWDTGGEPIIVDVHVVILVRLADFFWVNTQVECEEYGTGHAECSASLGPDTPGGFPHASEVMYLGCFAHHHGRDTAGVGSFTCSSGPTD